MSDKRFEGLQCELRRARQHFAGANHGLGFDMLAGVLDALLTALSDAGEAEQGADALFIGHKCAEVEALTAQLAAVQAENNTIRTAWLEARDCFHELNLGNYDDNDVHRAQEGWMTAFDIMEAALYGEAV